MLRLRHHALVLLVCSPPVGVLRPASLAAQAVAQGATERTHTVRTGDTLWDLAGQYLGSPYRWPEIYRLNNDKIRDPHWIEPGLLLRLPTGAIVGTLTVAKPAARPAADELAPAAPVPAAAPSPRPSTVFNTGAEKVNRATREALILGNRSSAVRAGEYGAAPFLWALGGPGGAGAIARATDAGNARLYIGDRPLQYQERVEVTLPKSAKGVVGEQLMAFKLGRIISPETQEVTPTGTVTLVSAAAGGRAQAVVTKQFAPMMPGQSLTLVDVPSLPIGVSPVRVEFGPVSRVVWLFGQPELVIPGQYVAVAAGTKDGLVPGDQLSLRADAPPGAAAGAADSEIAVAQVTRVTEWGSSAIVLRINQPGIAVGMRARVTAKMP